MDSLISERRLICEIRSFTAAKSRAVHNKPIRDFSKWCPAQTARTCRGGPPWPPQGGQLGHSESHAPSLRDFRRATRVGVQSKFKNSSTVRPAWRIKARSVPMESSLCLRN